MIAFLLIGGTDEPYDGCIVVSHDAPIAALVMPKKQQTPAFTFARIAMTKRRTRERTRKQRKLMEQRKRKAKRKWLHAAIFLLIFGITLVPYIVDLVRHPNLDNAILLTVGAALIVSITILTFRHA